MCSISEPIRYHLMTICFRFPVDETRLCLQSDQQPYTREWQERHISANLYTFSKLYFSLSTWTVHMHATKPAQTWLVNPTWTTNGKQNLIYWLNSLCFCQPKIPTSLMPTFFGFTSDQRSRAVQMWSDNICVSDAGVLDLQCKQSGNVPASSPHGRTRPGPAALQHSPHDCYSHFNLPLHHMFTS